MIRASRSIHLARNFGHQLAITAGIELARGDAVIVMDGDLQHPPELLPALAERWREGYDVVYGVMTERPEGWLKRMTARVYYRVLRKLASVEIPAAAGDFRLADRRVVEAFRAMPERNRFVRGMFAWLGFRQIAVPYAVPERFAGSSKYTLRRMIRLATDGLVSFSTAPLRLALDLGFVVSGLAYPLRDRDPHHEARRRVPRPRLADDRPRDVVHRRDPADRDRRRR